MAAGRFCFLHFLNRKCASKITLLCFVVQMANHIKRQYLDTLPLANASKSFLDDLTDVQMNVGNLVWVYVCKFDWSCGYGLEDQTEWNKLFKFLCNGVGVVRIYVAVPTFLHPSQMQCCGLDQGYLDWLDNISESCLCTEESTKPCVSVKAIHRYVAFIGKTQKNSVSS